VDCKEGKIKMSEREPVHKHTVNLYEGDFQRLQDLYPDLGAGIVVRKLVRKHIKSVEKNVTPAKLEDLELDL